ncbi:ribonuclease H-like domain-containing protein [Neohortaea acidophila]|uniref:Ribonuclease H-like domain-containing protein n=1 Tax=Neohortaea acidophila TaxID=245834 RepID=A0A6A6PJ75_9PEZI|nr:ribonuclease H-like domain-containing protein [Neohortaea acidophila]KAF2479975.1 ribonuclease H-like domain-containing protein [Neohortaea acidophila]
MLSIIFKQHMEQHEQFGAMYPPLGAHATMGIYLNGYEEDPQDPRCQIPDGLVFFVDGSRLGQTGGGAGGGGVAYFFENAWKGAAFALGKVPDSKTAEMQAVAKALEVAEGIQLRGCRQIVVYTDCRDVIDDLMHPPPPPSLALSIHRHADLFEDHGIDVKLLWVKGHHLSLGNILADGLARRGSSLSLMLTGRGKPIEDRLIVIDHWDMVGRAERAGKDLADQQQDAQKLQDERDQGHLEKREVLRCVLVENGIRECPSWYDLEEGEIWEPPSQASQDLNYDEPGQASEGQEF